MLVYDLEFAQIKDCLNSLNGYSDANIKLLEILLNRYEEVIQDLYAIDGDFFQSSLETVSDLELEFHLLETEHGPVLLMKALFEDYRRRLIITINYETNRYEHFKLIRNINYN
jgi:cobalamin biosynthesis Co2+ chelatase CbiK